MFTARTRLDKCTDPLIRLIKIIDWKLFRPQLQRFRKNKLVGCNGYEMIMIFKIQILQALYNMVDDAAEYMLRDHI